MHDPGAHSLKCKETSKVRDLLRRGTFKFIFKSELPDGANTLTVRIVLALKSSAYGKIKY